MSSITDFYKGGGGFVGQISAFVGGYFTNGANGGFTSVLGNTASNINTLLNPDGFYVCDGSALNLPDSPIFNGSGRYLPNLSDSRFIQGSLSAGGSGGSSTMSHTHTIYHTHGMSHTHNTRSLTLSVAHLAYHRHGITYYGGGAGTGLLGGRNSGAVGVYSGYAGSNSAHNHGATYSSSISSTGGSSASSSGGATVTENRPKFLSAVYVMKVV